LCFDTNSRDTVCVLDTTSPLNLIGDVSDALDTRVNQHTWLHQGSVMGVSLPKWGPSLHSVLQNKTKKINERESNTRKALSSLLSLILLLIYAQIPKGILL